MSAAELPPTLRAKLNAGDNAELQKQIAHFLAQQRWYRHRGGPPQRIMLHAGAALSSSVFWCLARVSEHDGTQAVYQLPLCVCSPEAVAPHAVIVGEASELSGMVLADATQHAPARDKLLAALIGQRRLPTGDGFWEARTFVDTRTLLAAPSQLMQGEQSNTSIVYGNRAMLKLYRCLQPGINPDIEMTQYLTAHHPLTCVPRLFGTMAYHDAAGASFDACMLQAFIDDGTDGWTATLSLLSQWLQDGGNLANLPGLDAAHSLGHTVRLIHNALASSHGHEKDFVARPASPAQGASWLATAGAQVQQTLAALQQHRGRLGQQDQAIAAKLIARLQAANLDGQATASLLMPPAGDMGDLGACIRHHGDLHLGQVLQRQDGSFVIVDFEGEPLAALATRRRPHSPLRDVAGMLRSFDYACRTVCAQQPDHLTAAQIWRHAACGAFMKAYTGGKQTGAVDLLPRQHANMQALLRIFCREKAFYELHYELLHRPSWAAVPLAAIMQSLDGGDC